MSQVTAPELSLTCPGCRAGLPDGVPFLGAPLACPSCLRPVEGLVFPTFRKPATPGKSADALVVLEDAGCFYHSKNRAQVPCDICGRFLCALCDVELQGQHVCPSCLDTGRKKNRIKTLDNSRVLYGGIAAFTAFVPIIAFWPATIITAPLALFLALYGWRKPQSLTGKGRLAYLFAIVLSLIQMAAWGWLIISIVRWP